MDPVRAFWDPIANRFSKFPVLLSGVRLERAGRRVFESFLSDKFAVNLWDEDFPRSKAYTRSILQQGCVEIAGAFLMLQLCVSCASF